MEDRITPGLYLEMTDRPAAEYAATRVDELLALPGVRRATWWENCVPGRTEYPRRIPEFRRLAVYEIDAGFSPPPRPGDVRGLCFRRTARPGQGTIGRGPTLGLELVLISPRSEPEAQALRDWADFIHIRDIAAAQPPHFTMITPYENVTGGEPRWLHFYELDCTEAEPAFRNMTPATRERIGQYGTYSYAEWAGHPALVIDYVNTFRRVGAREAPRPGTPATPGRDLAPDNFFEVALSQRAHREFLHDSVPDDTIERLLEAATHSPSAENGQPWIFVVARDAELRSRIGACAEKMWASAGREYSRGRISGRFHEAIDRWADGGLAAAPVIVVVCGDTSLATPGALAASVYPATQNLCLAAHALGLGSLFSTLPTADMELATLLGLPSHIRPMTVVPLGFPARRLGPPKRISFREKTFRDRYGVAW